MRLLNLVRRILSGNDHFAKATCLLAALFVFNVCASEEVRASTDSGLDSMTNNLQIAVHGVAGITLFGPVTTPATSPYVSFAWPIYAESASFSGATVFTGATLFNGPLTFNSAPNFSGGLSTSTLTLTDNTESITVTPEILKLLYNLVNMPACAAGQAITLASPGTFTCMTVVVPSP